MRERERENFFPFHFNKSRYEEHEDSRGQLVLALTLNFWHNSLPQLKNKNASIYSNLLGYVPQSAFSTSPRMQCLLMTATEAKAFVL